jgi:hypothetical protein
VRPAHWPPRSDRDCPLDTARARCVWHVGGTAGEDKDGFHVAATASSLRVGESLHMTNCLAGKPRMRRGTGGGHLIERPAESVDSIPSESFSRKGGT